MRFVFPFLIAATLSACGQEQARRPSTPHDACGAVSGDGVVVADAWVRPAAEGQATTALYAVICNFGDTDDALVRAASDAAGAVELHETVRGPNASVGMGPIERLPIAARGQAALAPGGAHVMLIGLTRPISEGATIEVTLEFASSPPQAISVPARSDSAQHGEHEH